MEQICRHCRTLLSGGTRSPYHLSISRISNSELIKCDVCEAYLLCEQGNMELLQANPWPLADKVHTTGRIENTGFCRRH